MNTSILFILIALLICVYPRLSAQDLNDNTTWSSISVSKDLGHGWTTVLKPIHRRFNNFKDNQNNSLDYIFRKKISSNYAAQILGRTWFMPNAVNRQFIFIDFLQTILLGESPVLWRNRYRLHYAFDIAEIVDGDFFRVDTQLTIRKPWKVIPFISAEPFFRLDGNNQEIQRVRYAIGGKWTINSKTSFTGQYWREAFYGNVSNTDFNIWGFNMGYKL